MTADRNTLQGRRPFQLKPLDGVLLQRLALAASGLREGLTRLYATMSNNVAMNVAWALMSLPPMFRTCPFLIMAIAS
jgi:hypothetical protein